MKIKDIRVIVTCPGRNFVTVKVITDDGLYGVGDATLNGREMAVVAYLEEEGIEVKDAVSLEVSDNRAVAALDPEDLKDHWQRLDLGDCDALVVSACVQMRSLPVLEEVEQLSGLPTLSAATATTWAVLRALDLEPVVPGAGALLRSGSTTVSSTT